MTEDEARERWCPFARVVGVDTKGKVSATVVANRASEGISPNLTPEERQNPPTARCIGSRCMAWRWRGFVRWAASTGSDEDKRVIYEVREGAEAPNEGFCGLAGQP